TRRRRCCRPPDPSRSPALRDATTWLGPGREDEPVHEVPVADDHLVLADHQRDLAAAYVADIRDQRTARSPRGNPGRCGSARRPRRFPARLDAGHHLAPLPSTPLLTLPPNLPGRKAHK